MTSNIRPLLKWSLSFLGLATCIFFIAGFAFTINRSSFGYSAMVAIPNIWKSSESQKLDQATNQVSTEDASTNNKIILLWNSFYKSRDFGVGSFGRKAFTNHHCKVDTCTLETDRRLLNQSSAVVFHMRSNVNPFPTRANYRQLFVYFLRESPHHTYGSSGLYRKQFNITMTYRKDSDIPVPISKLRRVVNVSLTTYKLRYPLASKRRSVVWLVSHCSTPSKRERYAAALAKHIDVDIYGACGKHKCAHKQPCMERFERQYKFYLSFENSFCDDYVTEKYYRILNYEMIPIVYGRANYSSLGPPDAFINILDYPSPRHLANYLDYLSRNETAYSRYFQTRQLWKSTNVMGKAFCHLCELLHRTTYRRIYADVHRWWTNGACDLSTVQRLIASIN